MGNSNKFSIWHTIFFVAVALLILILLETRDSLSVGDELLRKPTVEEFLTVVQEDVIDCDITLVIPSLLFDIVLFGEDLFESFKTLTVVPREIIFVISDMENQKVDHKKFLRLKRKFATLEGYGIQPRFLEYPDKMSQSMAKNIGAASAKASVISIFDCDDVLHPQRFEVLSHIFTTRPSVNAVLTTFSFTNSEQLGNHYLSQDMYNMSVVDSKVYDPDDLRQKIRTQMDKGQYYFLEPNSNTVYTWCCAWFSPSLVANGWVSVRRSTWLQYQQRNDMRVGEDIEFVTRLITGSENLTVVDLVLGHYRWKTAQEGKVII
ncbi:hypothetical protein SARC_10860 [Sphaeroforma arctica JP610]|uniref:Glycosyltransferase 2-like domain-containing protein n=1 Tax=Sphaeroforma arctica JP610 TaxID=667725 RepID=A0A0L0FKW4_9EUKA|nr:hypothetical protein SARC_10860 [Sphaeroforma arctica JP610]KNC76648.1 hypothetical protein SARC_10860 [Sphaeroforma arctica JP610]|eukprot:XP_014150550.1 hypothetical protein SARC_10860 [Sphaeroforma arctica JP610]